MVIIIVSVIIFLLIVMPIEFRVIYTNARGDLEINLVKLLNIRIDLDKVIRYLLTTKGHREEITLEGIIYNFTIFRKSKNIFNTLARLTIIKKMTVIAYEDYEKNYLVINSWILLNYVKAILKNKFWRIKNDYYMVADDDRFRLNFEAIMEVRIIFIIIAIILNIKDVFKTIKFMRVYYGKSKSAKSNI